MKILLAVDGSGYTQRMCSYLATHKNFFGSGHTFTVLHCIEPMSVRAAALAGPEFVRNYYAQELAEVMTPIRALLAEAGIDAEEAHEVGNPADEIAAFADAGNFDLLMMGSHGHGALATLAMGSVSAKVLARCEVPVLLVR
jgi:nucleotide-binding universal stress UspA family protein